MTGRSPSGSGSRAPHEAASASSPEASIPNAAREDCDICGARPIRVIVEGRALCEQHRSEWLGEEFAAANEAQIGRVMAALDVCSERPITGEWSDHLRAMALAAIEAM
jgi:hypothetical protein